MSNSVTSRPPGFLASTTIIQNRYTFDIEVVTGKQTKEKGHHPGRLLSLPPRARRERADPRRRVGTTAQRRSLVRAGTLERLMTEEDFAGRSGRRDRSAPTPSSPYSVWRVQGPSGSSESSLELWPPYTLRRRWAGRESGEGMPQLPFGALGDSLLGSPS